MLDREIESCGKAYIKLLEVDLEDFAESGWGAVLMFATRTTVSGELDPTAR